MHNSLHDPEINNLKILFECKFNFQKADNNLLNKYAIYKFNQYAEINIKDYYLSDSIQMDFANFQVKHFDELDNAI